MAQKVLIIGESGTGKSTSLRNCDPTKTAIVNPVAKPLPFRGRFDTLDGVTNSKRIIEWVKAAVNRGKKIIVIDDFQYILSIPYMNRIKEAGWDKWNDFGSNYFELIDVCNDLPDDVIIYYLSHCETLEDGTTTIKLIGKLLREKITIEGLFTTVLRTQVADGRYCFLTQNSGKDTVKSPMDMFPGYAIDNDLKYVDDKIRNYYEIGDYKNDDEMAQDDAVKVNSEIEKASNGRIKRAKRAPEATERPTMNETETVKEVISDTPNDECGAPECPEGMEEAPFTVDGEPVYIEKIEPRQRRQRKTRN